VERIMPSSYIVLVEDDPDDEELTILALKEDYIAKELVVARDGAEAINLLLGPAARQEPPQLILLDLNLPKLNGLEVLQRTRADDRLRFVPVVMLTSSSQDEDIVAAYLHGANSYVRKPVVFEQFVAAVKQLGLYWMLVNESAPQS
jgi:two-component system response regulator